MAEVEPQFASDYDDRATVAVKSVLVEIGQVLGSYKGKFAVIGGAVPWLLLSEADMPNLLQHPQLPGRRRRPRRGNAAAPRLRDGEDRLSPYLGEVPPPGRFRADQRAAVR